MRILITGATGLVGNNCARQLLIDGHEVHALVRQGHDPRPFEGLNIHSHLADLLRVDQIEPAIPGVDAIIHSAGDTHIGRVPRPIQHQVNVEATAEIGKIALRRNLKLVFVSSVDALAAGSPTHVIDEESDHVEKYPCGYVQTKRAAEQELQTLTDRGLEAVIVNPGFMLGPWDWKPSSGRMLLEVATKFTPFGPRGGFSVCDVREVSRAICRVATDATQHTRYILAGNNVRYVDAWKVFAKVAKASPPIAPAGPLAVKFTGWFGDLATRVRGREGDVNSAGIGMSNLFHYYDSGRAQQELDYVIPTMEESASVAWDWFREYGYVHGQRR